MNLSSPQIPTLIQPLIHPLIAALLLAGSISLPAHAANEPATSFSILLRLQAELVNASGSAAEARDRDGWHITDAWGGGNPNSGNWGGVYFDLSHRISDDVSAIGRYALAFDVDGRKDDDRDIWVGLASKQFGTVTLGRLETPYKRAGIAWDPLNGTFMQARGNQARSGTAFGHNSYLDRSLNYRHVFGTVQFSALVGIDDSSDPGTGKTRGEHTYSFSLVAPVGPVELMLAHIDGSEYRGGPDERTGTKFGARYSAGDFSIGGHYEFRGEGAEDGDYLFLSSSYRVDKIQYHLNYGQFKDDRDGRGNDGEYFAVGARYTYREGVALHAGFRRSDQDITGTENMFGLGLRLSYNTGNLLAR